MVLTPIFQAAVGKKQKTCEVLYKWFPFLHVCIADATWSLHTGLTILSHLHCFEQDDENLEQETQLHDEPGPSFKKVAIKAPR